jgi:hypothetical protein
MKSNNSSRNIGNEIMTKRGLDNMVEVVLWINFNMKFKEEL